MNKTWTIIGLILVIILGAWWFNSNQSGISLSPDATATPKVSATKTPAVSGSKPTATPVATPVLSYSQLVAKYGSDRIQFDSDCKATPNSMVFKNGGSILLDNRSSKTAVVSVGDNKYTLGAYGYQVVTLNSSTVPKMLSVTCNGRVNTSTINLQANISGQ